MIYITASRSDFNLHLPGYFQQEERIWGILGFAIAIFVFRKVDFLRKMKEKFNILGLYANIYIFIHECNRCVC